MQIKCEYCGNYFSDKEEVCPFCNAPNDGIIRTGSDVPTTIEGLKEYVKKHGIPAENLRFFIGQNYTGPKAFGIYKDEELGEFVVYKNKSDGSRAVRYQGKDEAYAVNEIYQKLKEEINEYKSFENNKKSRAASKNAGSNGGSSNRSSGGNRPNGSFKKVLVIAIIAISIIIIAGGRGCARAVPHILSGFSSGYSTDYEDSGSSWSFWDDDDDDDDWGSGSDWDDDWDSDWDSDWAPG